MAKNILISGGSGLVGAELSHFLKSRGYNVAILSRRESSTKGLVFKWDLNTRYIDAEAIEFADIIIHLAGEGVAAKRWSSKQKKKIIDSRVKSTELLFEQVKKAKKKPELIISASAVGFYGHKPSDHVFVEEDASGSDFLSQVVRAWEESVMAFEDIGIRTMRIRIGVVLAKNGGFLEPLKKIVRFGLAAGVGSGRQFIPWIELSDLARIFHFAVEGRLSGSVYNAVAPEFITNKELMRSLARHMKRPFFLPNIPSFILRLLYGEMAEIILYGNRVSSEKIRSEGFEFQFTSFDAVMEEYFD